MDFLASKVLVCGIEPDKKGQKPKSSSTCVVNQQLHQ